MKQAFSNCDLANIFRYIIDIVFRWVMQSLCNTMYKLLFSCVDEPTSKYQQLPPRNIRDIHKNMGHLQTVPVSFSFWFRVTEVHNDTNDSVIYRLITDTLYFYDPFNSVKCSSVPFKISRMMNEMFRETLFDGFWSSKCKIGPSYALPTAKTYLL